MASRNFTCTPLGLKPRTFLVPGGAIPVRDHPRGLHSNVFGLPILVFKSKNIGQRIWEKVRSYWEHVGGHMGTWGT